MATPARFTVRIRYPFEPSEGVRDEAWLRACVDRHDGTLDPTVMWSEPVQRDATFASAADARAFVTDLTGTARWPAHLMIAN